MAIDVVVEFDDGAKAYSAVCLELPGCASAGETEEEARANLEEAVRLYLECSGRMCSDENLGSGGR